jgi:hypothetical protein
LRAGADLPTLSRINIAHFADPFPIHRNGGPAAKHRRRKHDQVHTAILFASAVALATTLPALSKPAVVHFLPPNHTAINQAGKAGGFRSPADSNAVVITSFTAGFSDPNGVLPNFDEVPGAGVDNWDIALPVAVLHIGDNYTYQMTFHSVSFTGTCKATYKLTQVQGSQTVTLTPAPSSRNSTARRLRFGRTSSTPRRSRIRPGQRPSSAPWSSVETNQP